jgi:hypothetical protein
VVKCPTCKKDLKNASKEWDLKKTHVKQYECCGNKVREYISNNQTNTAKSPKKRKFSKRIREFFNR